MVQVDFIVIISEIMQRMLVHPSYMISLILVHFLPVLRQYLVGFIMLSSYTYTCMYTYLLLPSAFHWPPPDTLPLHSVLLLFFLKEFLLA
jgi:hypothetical protein